ncbi:MAG: PAS domain S-box protein [Caldilineaceae bacterium]
MTATRYSIDVPDEGGVDTLPSSGAEASPPPVATWLKLVDFALCASILLLIFTEQKIFYFHLVFVLLTFGAFYWQLQGFVLRAGIYVSVITLTLIAFVITGHIHSEELVEIPMMTTILLLVFTIARQRTLAEDALREANDGLEKRVLARTAALRQEVSEHRKTAQTLWASEARYRHLVQLAFEAIVIHTETEILYLNPAGMELFGLVGPTELQGRSFLEFVHPDERESVALSLQQVQSEGKGVPLTERKFIRCDGNEIDVETATISILDNGQAALQTVIRDISIRKQTEQARLDERMSIARPARLDWPELGVLAFKT